MAVLEFDNDIYIVEHLPQTNKWRAYNKTQRLWGKEWSNHYSTKQSAINAVKRKANKGDKLRVYKKDGSKHYQKQI